jgi:hypothetical protein
METESVRPTDFQHTFERLFLIKRIVYLFSNNYLAHNLNLWKPLKFMDEYSALLFCMWKVPGSVERLETGYFEWDFCGFPSSLQEILVQFLRIHNNHFNNLPI